MGGGGGVMWTGGMVKHETSRDEDHELQRMEYMCQAQKDMLSDDQLISIIRGLERVYVVADIDEDNLISAETIVLRKGLIQEVTWEEALGTLRCRPQSSESSS